MKLFKTSVLIAIFTVFLSACAATGSPFQGVEVASSSNLGVVYFYRPKAFVGGGVRVQVQDNENDILTLKNGQFVKYESTPGTHEFRTATMAIDKAVEIDIEAGQNYFIRAGIRQGAWTSTWFLSRVYDEEALAELQTCCLSGE